MQGRDSALCRGHGGSRGQTRSCWPALQSTLYRRPDAARAKRTVIRLHPNRFAVLELDILSSLPYPTAAQFTYGRQC
jgi:hypothetical protein